MLVTVLNAIARTGKLWLVAGLLGGVLLRDVPQALRPWLPELVALLLFLAALRIGAPAAFGQLREAKEGIWTVLALQLGVPLAALGLLTATGAMRHEMAVVFVLLMSAPSVTASVNFAILLGRDPAPALRLLILGTALVPLTALPILWALPILGAPSAVIAASLKLLATIAVAVSLGFAARHWLAREATPRFLGALDGLSVIVLAVTVLGLMSAIGPALETRPAEVAAWLAFACAANFGMQMATAFLLSRWPPGTGRVPISLIAGNRNIALYLVALPPDTVEPLLIFLGCYQVPMYLTPLLMARFYARVLPEGAGEKA